MDFGISLRSLGELIYTIPAGLVIFFSRAAFHEMLERRIEGLEKKEITESIDIFGLGVFLLYGVSWGGMLYSSRKNNMIIFLLNQLFFIFAILVTIVYLILKNPQEGTYVFFFSVKMLQYLVTLFIVNWVPLPPFDAAILYWTPRGRFSVMDRLNTVFKLSVFLILVFGWFDINSIISLSYLTEKVL